MTPEVMRRVILEQQDKINQSKRIHENIEATSTSVQRLGPGHVRLMQEKSEQR